MNKTTFHNALMWVEDNLSTGEDIGRLVSENGYSRRAFELGFRHRTGFSPGEYLFRRRMTRAAVILRMTALPVTEIAALLHYYSGQNFTRAFGRFSGWTPTAYRRTTTWHTHMLQLSLLYEESSVHPVMVNVGQRVCLVGNRRYAESRYDSMCDHDYMSALRSQINSLPSTVFPGAMVFSRRTGASDAYTSRKGVVRVEVVVGTQVASGGHADAIIPAGSYARYEFKGTWEAFVVFSRMIYIKSLPVQKLHCARDFSFMRVYSVGDCLTCALYIPVALPPG